MNLLVTGGSGFIGSNFINYWLKKHPGDQITNVDKLTYAADPAFVPTSGGKDSYILLKADICDYERMREITKNIDVIINFAAESHVDRSIEDASSFVNSNIIGVHNLLRIVRDRKLRFHQVSTDEVYGSLTLDSKEKFNARSPYNPKNPYSASKAAADFMVRAFHNTYGLPVTISNCSNNYGPLQHPEKLIPKTILFALEERKVPIYGNGRQVRDWIYVEDHCSALEIVLESGVYGSTVLIGGGNEYSNIDTVSLILKLMDVPMDIIEFVKDRPGHDVRYAIDSSDFQNETGWKPIVNFRDGLIKTIEHYRKGREKYLARMTVNL